MEQAPALPTPTPKPTITGGASVTLGPGTNSVKALGFKPVIRFPKPISDRIRFSDGLNLVLVWRYSPFVSLRRWRTLQSSDSEHVLTVLTVVLKLSGSPYRK